MTVPHGRTRLVVAVVSLLTAAVPATAWAQSPSAPASPVAQPSAIASQVPASTAPSVAATAAPSAPASVAPSAGASPAASPGPSWTPPPASGPVALLTAGGTDDGRTTALRSAFEATLRESCPTATLDPSSADTAETQAEQARQAVTSGARVIVLDPVDPAAAGAVVSEAQTAGAMVIALGDAITGAVPDYQVAYDPSATGPLVASVVISVAADAADQGLSGDATPIPSDAPVEKVVLIDGPEGDADLAAWTAKVKQGLGVRGTVVHEAAVTELTAVEGKRVIGEAIDALGKDGFGAVITPGDPVAAGVIAGLDEAGIDPTTVSVTGLDATLPGAQAIVVRDQLLTTWAPETDAAQVAAAIACGAAIGSGFPEGLTTTPVDSGAGEVPTVLLTGIVVTSDGSVTGSRSIADTLVADDAFGPDTAAQICTDDLAQACDDAGIVVPSPSPVPSASPAPGSAAPGSPATGSPAVGSPGASGSPAVGSPGASGAAPTSPATSPSAATSASPVASQAPAPS